MKLQIQRIEIEGDPTSSDMVDLPVRLTYADAANLDAATEWLQVRMKSPAAYGRALAEVERDVLSQLKAAIVERIEQLRSLEGRH